MLSGGYQSLDLIANNVARKHYNIMINLKKKKQLLKCQRKWGNSPKGDGRFD